MPALTKVLQHAYGRAGHRRHTLLNAHLSEQDSHSDAEPPTAISPAVRRTTTPPKTVTPNGGGSVPAKPHNAPPTAFERFLADQILRYPANSTRTRLKTVYAPIPLENVFLRPTSRKREENMRKRWLVETKDKILPPLPEEEWNRLRDLVTGAVEWEGAPKRRTRAREAEKEGGGGLLSVEYLKAPIRHAHSKVLKAQIEKRDWHELTPSYMRRMYGRIWEQCPKARWDEELRDWVYTWGGTKIAADKGVPRTIARRDLCLFEGIEELPEAHVKGKKIRSPSKKVTAEDMEARVSGPNKN
jgi:hypothetical protein